MWNLDIAHPTEGGQSDAAPTEGGQSVAGSTEGGQSVADGPVSEDRLSFLPGSVPPNAEGSEAP